MQDFLLYGLKISEVFGAVAEAVGLLCAFYGLVEMIFAPIGAGTDVGVLFDVTEVSGQKKTSCECETESLRFA